ncbi:MAG: hypothetical protein VW270_27880 [Candidatus Poseidoniales archaeon]
MAAPSYPLSYPTDVGFKASTFSISRTVAVVESPFTGTQQTHEHDRALWKATMSLPPMARSTASKWLAFFMKLHGRKGTFLLGDPDAKTAQGAITGSVTLNADIAIGDYDIELLTSLTSTSDVFKAGDYIQINTGSSAKLHMIVEDADTDGSGVATVTVEPPIKTVQTATTDVIYSGAKGVFSMDVNVLGWDADYMSKFGISFSCTEAL